VVPGVLTLRIAMLIHETCVLRLCDRCQICALALAWNGGCSAPLGELSIRRSVDLSELTQW